ncbi:MAG TPA: 4Fe-4S dicluster domain-containing protein [Cellulomonas sp.]
MRIGTITERLAADRYETDEQESHILIDQEGVRRTGCAAMLVAVCPAGVYAQEADGTLSAEYAACFECGACAAVAPAEALSWHYPRGGTGIQLREG